MQRSLLCSPLGEENGLTAAFFSLACSKEKETTYHYFVTTLFFTKTLCTAAQFLSVARRYILRTCRELSLTTVWYCSCEQYLMLCVGDEKTSLARNFLTRHTTYSSSEYLHTLIRNVPAGRRFHSRTFRSGPYQPHLQLMKVESVLLLDMRLSNIAYLLEFE